MIVIGENIHVIAKAVNEAVKARDAKPIQDLARAQAEAGADYIDLNLGFCRKDPTVMGWAVNIVQDVVGLPLSIDTMNPVAMEEGLKVCKKRPLLNSASGKTDSKQEMLPLAKKYDCDVVISVINDKGMPAEGDSKLDSIMDTIAYANDLGIPNERIWADPIVLPASTAGEGQKNAVATYEFVEMLPEALPGSNSLVGLSNVSSGAPVENRPLLNRVYLVILARKGLSASIHDALDEEMMKICRGERQNIVDLIYRTMDGEDMDLSSLSKEEVDYVKTTKVLTGEVLYSGAWLES
ncbi:MAG: dihydropteroate synthase [Dehalococcoidia bacterium]|nr:dihydropteroate synthase [Dehalococcoidia bacterium]